MCLSACCCESLVTHQTYCIPPIVSERGNALSLTWLCYSVMRSVFCLLSPWLTPLIRPLSRCVCIVIFLPMGNEPHGGKIKEWEFGKNKRKGEKQSRCTEGAPGSDYRSKKKQETKKKMTVKNDRKFNKADRVFKMAKTDALRVTCAPCGKVKQVRAQGFQYSLTLRRSSNPPGTLPLFKVWYCICIQY